MGVAITMEDAIGDLSASFRFRDEGGVERHLAVAPTFSLVEMVRGRAPPRCFLEVTFTSLASGCFEAAPA